MGLTRVLRWLRGPWVADSVAPDLSWLDRKDGLDTRRLRWTDEALAILGAEAPVTRWDVPLTRYETQWPDVLAAEVPGGDLAAMAAPLPGMARDDLGVCAEPVKPRGRHRQTDPLDLILADLRDLGGLT